MSTFDYLFVDNESGEEFFVELDICGTDASEGIAKATEIAESYFDEPELMDIVEDWIAEAYGYDTYTE